MATNLFRRYIPRCYRRFMFRKSMNFGMIICGNHDACLYGSKIDGLDKNVHYLCNLRLLCP